MEAKSGIYHIVNKVNGKRYIGSAVLLSKRLRQHKSDLAAGRHVNPHLQRAYDKYGEAAFEYTVAAVTNKPEDLIQVEQRHIDQFDFNNLYNLCPSAGSPLGLKRTSEARKKMSDKRKQRWSDPDYKATRVAALKKLGEQQRGSGHPNAKLTEQTVKEIKHWITGGFSQRSIAKAYGVHQKQIHSISTNKTWTHVQAGDI